MINVNFSFSTSHELDVNHASSMIPLLEENYMPFKSFTKESKDVRKGVIFQKCPAHTDYTKNTFVFCAPFDLSLEVDFNKENESCTVYSENLNQHAFDQIIDTRFLRKSERGNSPYPLIGIDWLCTFTSEANLKMTVTPAFMHYNDFTNKTSIIPGEYDIGKWTRPVECVFEIKKQKEKILIKKGDAISYIKFYCDDAVKLIKQDVPWEEIKICNNIRQADTFRPLKERYKSLEAVRTQQKCPYEPKN